jgi:hypothetical protein
MGVKGQEMAVRDAEAEPSRLREALISSPVSPPATNSTIGTLPEGPNRMLLDDNVPV